MVTSTVGYAPLLLICERLSLKRIVTDLSETIALFPATSCRPATWRAGGTATALFLRNWRTVSTGQTESDWQAILIHSDGQNRENDDFVEAHIYEGFDSNAIESLIAIPGKKLRKEDALDLEIAISKFKHLRGEN